ncbi:MAG: hypothetical protein IT244_00100 [Bacteroidia bacterium]|nr:hypothetical protein [Bacteroidia bacterium]
MVIAVSAQLRADMRPVRVEFQLKFNNETLQLGKKYYSNTLKDSISFETLKFYISRVIVNGELHSGAPFSPEAFLIDAENPKSQILQNSFYLDSVLGISFLLGVDSMANVSGAMGGDLDPMFGMYWAWQSGYINFKLEGYTNSCPSPKHQFQYHIGGYLPPYASSRALNFEVENTGNVVVEFDVEKLISQLNIQEQYEVMGPGNAAMDISKKVASVFKIKE